MHSSKVLPLQIVRSRVFVLLVWTEWAYISRRIMDEAVSDHLILPFESFPAGSTRTASYGTEMRTILRMNICMGAVHAISLGYGAGTRETAYFNRYCVWNGAAVQPG